MTMNKNELEQLRDNLTMHKIDYEDLPQDVTIKLLQFAVSKIDYLDNIVIPGNDIDERDAMDITCDEEFIISDLFDEIIEALEYEKN